MIDLIRLSINMLKTNYISQNLAGFIRKLIRRTDKIKIALLLQPLFDYQPVPRKVLLTELYNHDEPLFNPVWFSSQMWILIFDEELGGLARKIINKFGNTLRYECLDISLEKETQNIFHYLREKNFGIFSLTTKAVGSAMELFRLSPKLKNIIQDLITFYDQEWEIIDKDAREAFESERYNTTFAVQRTLKADQRMNRMAVANILERCAKLIQPAQFETVLTFLITKSCQDQTDEVREASAQAALVLIKSQGEEYSSQLLQVIDIFLNAQGGVLGNDASKNQAVTLLGYLAHYLGEMSQKKLIVAYEKLVELLPKSSLPVQRSICKCISQLAKYFPDKAKAYLEKHLETLAQDKSEKALIASAYATAGLCKSLGMTYINEIDLFAVTHKQSFESKKADPLRK
jgi:hypothetical protein